MKKIYRFTHNSDYWDNRWEKNGVDNNNFQKLRFYPIKQSEEFLKKYNINENILELGCGAGRVFFHYKNKKYNINGIEYSKIAVNNIQKILTNKNEVIQGNVLSLPYLDESFNYILAFGLFHNIEELEDIQKAFNESSRILKPNGKILFSVRFDSFENNLIERIIKNRNNDKTFNKFHRYHFDLENTKKFLNNANLTIKSIEYSRNVSFLFKFNFFRSKEMKEKSFNESKARSEGFQLNFLGKIIDQFLHSFFPKQFSNLIIISAEKND